MHVAVFEYTGTGIAHQIPLPFTPLSVFVQVENGSAYWCSSAMPVDFVLTPVGTGAAVTNAITSLDANGFTLGTGALNANGVAHWGFALGDDGSNDVEVGSYAGNSTAGRVLALSHAALAPALFWTKAAGNQSFYRTTSFSANNSSQWNAAADAVNRITAFGTGTVTLGANAGANGTGNTYYYLAVAETANRFHADAYTGNANDDRAITGYGFQPDIVFDKRNGASAMILMTRYQAADAALTITGVIVANAIQRLNADGFEVGTAVEANNSGDAYRHFGWKVSQEGIARLVGIDGLTKLVNSGIANT